jgi:hypothetical protein
VLWPVDAIAPTVKFPPAMPFTSHVTFVPAARQNDAENDCVWSSPTSAVDGEIEFVALHVIVALAFPLLELSALLVAVIVTVAGFGGTGGAVYSPVVTPLLAIVPTVAFPPAIPFTLHTTPPVSLPSPATVAVKACSPPVGTLAVCGDTVTVTPSLSVTLAESLADDSAWLTAVTITLGGDGSTVGAVYVAVSAPVDAIVPIVEFPPATPFASHDTFVFDVPLTVT